MNKYISTILLAVFTIFSSIASSANTCSIIVLQKITIDTRSDSCNYLKIIAVNDDATDSLNADMCLPILQKDSLLTDTLPSINKITKKKKIIAALFAFPFPFGFVGAHRVMLGTKPWVPIIYVATFGGCFGLLPLIDFCVIIFHKDVERYENNDDIFMWLKD